METATIKDGISSLIFSKTREVPDDEIVRIVFHAQSHPALTR
jgi:hypothetical protein